MMSYLRHLSVFIEETKPMTFTWDLCEIAEGDSDWGYLATGGRTHPTWIEAWRAGSDELLRFVADERIGPRAAGEDEDAAPVG